MPESLQQLERRYVDLAGGLKACWAFERFFNRLRRVHPRDDLEDPAVDFSTAQRRLRSIAEDLETGTSEDLSDRFDRLEADLLGNAARLSAQDSRIGASDVRRFLSRVRRLDEDLLLGMLRFYQFSRRGDSWDADLVDKVDFLLSRLGEQISGPLLRRDLLRLHSALAMLWETASIEPPRPPVVRAMRQSVQEIASKLRSVESFDSLEEIDLVPSYRRLKHGMGALLVEPSVAEAVLRTNAALGRAMHRFYNDEEWSIAADFARFAMLETTAGLSEALSLELESLRRDMERIEEGRRVDDVRFTTVQRVRRQVKALRPQVEGAPLPPTWPIPDATGGVVDVVPGEEELAADLLERLFHQLESLLSASGSVEEAEDILQDPGLPFGLERRELAAFLSLRDDGVGGPVDRLVLTAASLRLRLQTIRGGLEAGLSGEVEQEALRALTLAERMMGDFDSEIATADARAEMAWAAEARFLKVLLMRDFSTLWLEMRGPQREASGE